VSRIFIKIDEVTRAARQAEDAEENGEREEDYL
jgi:hypothetical protein